MDRRTAILHLFPGLHPTATTVRGVLRGLPGITAAGMDVADAVLFVRYDAGAIDLSTLVRVIEDAGVRIRDLALRPEHPEDRARPAQRLRRRRAVVAEAAGARTIEL